MKNRIPACASLVALVWIVASIATAQQNAGGTTMGASNAVPGLISYSGVLKDTGGQTRTGVTGATFLLYREQEGGTPLWMETQNVVPDATGRYTAQLGATTANGMPASLFQTGEARWLAVRINGGEEQARVPLVAVPYAMKAVDAETLGGLPVSAFVLAAPVSGGSGGVAAAAAASSDSPAVSPAAAVTGSGTANYVPL